MCHAIGWLVGSFLKALQQKLEKPNFLQKIANRFFGAEQKIQQDIEVHKATQKNAQQRYDEQMAAMKQQAEQALQKLKLKQQEELMRLKQTHRQQQLNEQTLSQEWKQVAHQHHHQSQRTIRYPKDRDGPSYQR